MSGQEAGGGRGKQGEEGSGGGARGLTGGVVVCVGVHSSVQQPEAASSSRHPRRQGHASRIAQDRTGWCVLGVCWVCAR